MGEPYGVGDAQKLRAFAAEIRDELAIRRRGELAGQLRSLAIMLDATAIEIEEQDEFKAEAATAPGHERPAVGRTATRRGLFPMKG
jgi:hypothetical protein